MKERFKRINFTEPRLHIIELCNQVIAELAAEGYNMTLRQLYYQMFSRDLFPDTWIDPEYNKRHNLAPNTKNTEKNYGRLGAIVNDARLAGLIDWYSITDRTRGVRRQTHWTSPESIIDSTAANYLTNKWDTQKVRIEVWIEKDALVGVFEPVARRLDLPLFSCRGYNSQSDMYNAGKRLKGYLEDGKEVKVLHFGDHDASGLDMTRDIRERLQMFTRGTNILVDRLALNMMQIDEFKPPPNPTKETDSRARKYIEIFGNDCYELDALSPKKLNELVETQVTSFLDLESWKAAEVIEEEQREILRDISNHFDFFEKYLLRKRARTW